MPNTMPDMVSRPAVVKQSLLGCEWSRKVQKLKTTKFQNQAVPKPGGAARGGVYVTPNTAAFLNPNTGIFSPVLKATVLGG